ncbi:MAG: PHP domain-containing protein, partial [Defluviitaleaceae bacterium]|nr:PHP domain-containing protein [Defluviitaleaceae bacterium]
ELASPISGENVNNHIHTIYSFSPYSPAMAAYLAWKAGLATAGIMDHDSVGGLREFIEAGRIINLPVTVGFECRASFKVTAFEGKRINNPDQNSVGYLAMHAIPHDKIDVAEDFLAPLRKSRNMRNRLMTEKLSNIVQTVGININFDKDVLPLSQHNDGGSVTERHILFALAEKIMDAAKPGPGVVKLLKDNFGINPSGSVLEKLNNPESTWYRYYLLAALKGNLVESFYIDAKEELLGYQDFIRLAEVLGAIPAYAYLGDVTDSVTGDKKAQHFEDAYLDDLVAFLKNAGFKAITYMPSRNTAAQLARLMALCEKHGLMQISGEDINSPFQPFICEAIEKPEYRHLIASAWALIEHERKMKP